MNKQSEYLTIKEAAKLLGVTSTTLRNWDKSGKLVAERHPINGYRLYSLDRMMELVREQGTVYQNSNANSYPISHSTYAFPHFPYTPTVRYPCLSPVDSPNEQCFSRLYGGRFARTL